MRIRRILFIAAISAWFSIAVYPQSLAKQPSKTTTTASSKEKTAASAELAAEKRRTATALLNSLAEEANGFRDNKLRAHVLGQAADALWPSDAEKSTAMFRRAWSEAETADRAAMDKAAQDAKSQRARGPMVVRRQRDARSEILLLATKRDRKLGEEFLKALNDSQKQEAEQATAATNNSGMDSSQPSIADSKRLDLASQLLQSGDSEKALQIAGPALVRVNNQSVFFLSELREKSPELADKVFMSLVQIAASDPATDANTVSGLSSYVFTPFMYVTFSKDGGISMSQSRRPSKSADVPDAVRRGFLQFAAMVFERPLPAPDIDSSTSGRVGKALVIKRMLPMFEQFLPESLALLNSTLSSLSADSPQVANWDDKSNLRRGLFPDNSNRDTTQEMQDRLDKAKDATEIDAIYADYAISTTDYPKAKGLADRISDTELHKQIRSYIDVQAIGRMVGDKKGVDDALAIVHDGFLDHYQKAWALSQASRTIKATDKVRAAEILSDALSEARRIGDGEPSDNVEANRARAMVAIATRFAEFDKTRAWEMMPDVVKASNNAPSYTGQDNAIGGMIRTKFMNMAMFSSVEDFDVTGLFKTLADADLDRAIETAKGFSADSTRAAATIAIARSVLDKKV